MPAGNTKHIFHLHFLVFIAGFTAVLGKLISIKAVPLVWYRMLFAAVLMYLYIRLRKININVSKATIIRFLLAGVVIALHWITFFASINASNISITLAMFSTGALFAAILEPIVYKRNVKAYEILFGLLIIFGVYLIVDSEIKYVNGIVLGISSAFCSSLFAVINGKLVQKNDATTISFYEFVGGVLFITLYIVFFDSGFNSQFFSLNTNDVVYLLILSSICTAYAFIAAVHIMKYLSPYTVVLAYNLEPIYGILIALMLFGESEVMSTNFYLGAALLVLVVIANGLLKTNKKLLKFKRN